MLETKLTESKAKQDEEIQRGRAGKENSSGEAGRQQAEHTAGKGRRGSRNWERMQEEVPLHHKMMGIWGSFPKTWSHRVKAEHKDWEEVLWWQRWDDVTIVFTVLSVAMPTSPWSAWCKLSLTPSSEVPLSPGQHRQSPGDTSPTFSERSWLRRHFLFETIYPASVRKSQWEPPAAPGVNCLPCEMPTLMGRAE